jgi:hypothetical protein
MAAVRGEQRLPVLEIEDVVMDDAIEPLALPTKRYS